jgi:hypothetical protein
VDEGDSAVTDLTDEELGLLLPGLAALISQASQEQGLDLSVDADGLRKILAYAAGGRVHGDHAPPEVPPSPVAVKSLLSSPFRHRAKAIRPVQIQRRGGRSYTAHYDDVARKWVKKPAGQTLPDAPTVPPVPEKKVPAWSELKDQYRNPGQWVESAFATEEARDRARATPQYRAMVEAWADDKGRQWAAGDPRQDKEPAKAPSGPGAPGWVDVPLTLTGEAADKHLADVFRSAHAKYDSEVYLPSGARSHAKSTAAAAARMPRRARDLLADGLKEVRYASTRHGVSDRIEEDAERTVEALLSRPELFAQNFRMVMEGRKLPDGSRFSQADMDRIIDIGTRLNRPENAAYRRLAKEFLMLEVTVQARLSYGHLGGVYDDVTGVVYADGPFASDVISWVSEAASGADEGRYRFSTADDSQTDLHAHELTHAIDKGHRFSATPAWHDIWKEELGGDPELSAKVAAQWWPDKKFPLTVYAARNPQEGLAEAGRILYGGGTDLEEFQKRFPRVAEFFRSNGLWPEGGGDSVEYPDVFVASLPFLGETSHMDLLASAWKEVKAIFRGRDRR